MRWTALPLALVVACASPAPPPVTAPPVPRRPWKIPERHPAFAMGPGEPGKRLLVHADPSWVFPHHVFDFAELSDGSAIVLADDHSGRILIRVDAKGNQMWSQAARSYPTSVVAGRSALVYSVLNDSLRWRNRSLDSGTVEREGRVDYVAGVAKTADGRLLVVQRDRSVSMLADDGKAVWSRRIVNPAGDPSLDDLSLTSPALTAGGTMLIDAGAGVLVALGSRSEELWRRAFVGRLQGIAARGERVAVVTTAGEVTSLDSDGRLAWSALVEGAEPRSLVWSNDGTLRIDNEDNEDFRFDQNGKPVAGFSASPIRLGSHLDFEVVLDRNPGALLVLGDDDAWAGNAHFDGHTWRPAVVADRDRYTRQSRARGFDGGVWQSDVEVVEGEIPGTIASATLSVWSSRAPKKRLTRTRLSALLAVPMASDATSLLACTFDYEASDCFQFSKSGVKESNANFHVTSIHYVAGVPWIAGRSGEDGQVARWSGSDWEDVSPPAAPPLGAIWGSAPDDVWVASGPTESYGRFEASGGPRRLFHFDGTKWSASRAPLRRVTSGWSAAKNDVWLVGDGQVAHFDGRDWTRQLGVFHDVIEVTGTSPNNVWLAGPGGVFRGRAPGASPHDRVVVGEPAEPHPVATQRTAPRVPPRATVARAALPLAGGGVLQSAHAVDVAPDGSVWFLEGKSVYAFDGQRARKVSSFRSAPRALTASSSKVARIAGESEIRGLGTPGIPGIGNDVTAITETPNGALWVAATRKDTRPPLRSLSGSTWTHYEATPRMHVFALDAASDTDVWMAGGTSATASSGGLWPAGGGVIAHFDGEKMAAWSSPVGSFLGVCALGKGQAFAVGVRGSVMRVTPFDAERWTLDPRYWLRDAWASGADDVWIVGDGSSIYHFDGRHFAQLDAGVAGRAAAFTSVSGSAGGDVWVVGPSGIFRVHRSP